MIDDDGDDEDTDYTYAVGVDQDIVCQRQGDSNLREMADLVITSERQLMRIYYTIMMEWIMDA